MMSMIIGLIVVAVILIYNLVLAWDIRRLKNLLLFMDDTKK